MALTKCFYDELIYENNCHSTTRRRWFCCCAAVYATTQKIEFNSAYTVISVWPNIIMTPIWNNEKDRSFFSLAKWARKNATKNKRSQRKQLQQQQKRTDQFSGNKFFFYFYFFFFLCMPNNNKWPCFSPFPVCAQENHLRLLPVLFVVYVYMSCFDWKTNFYPINNNGDAILNWKRNFRATCFFFCCVDARFWCLANFFRFKRTNRPHIFYSSDLNILLFLLCFVFFAQCKWIRWKFSVKPIWYA